MNDQYSVRWFDTKGESHETERCEDLVSALKAVLYQATELVVTPTNERNIIVHSTES